MKILYVEDNKINAVVMSKMLSKNAYNVISVPNAQAALQKATTFKFDLILIDINLGVNQMDGCQLLKALRLIETVKVIPIYAVTAYALPGDETRFLQQGFDQYFSKPVNFEKLLDAIAIL
ncbi:response regulator [Aquimarina sp. W85]|uniref:response regulator n=1 Tax=Aquimarina rhodophyticola TaxID=3342246 RepID=UPI0036705953